MLHTSQLYTAAQVRELDRLAIAGTAGSGSGIPAIQLMKRAGKSAFDLLLECWHRPERITVYCGTGNNGGDGYIVAALAQLRQIPVCVIQVGDHTNLKAEAKLAYDYAHAQSVEMIVFELAKEPTEGIIVDALLGTGLAIRTDTDTIRAPFKQAIAQINRSMLPVLAIDVPSGLNSDTGSICGKGEEDAMCVRADLTATFIGLKRGLFTHCGSENAGEVFFDDLGVPSDIYTAISSGIEKLELENCLSSLQTRKRHAHKGHFGHVLVMGGDSGYGGAALMAAETAARCGAGLVSVATRAEHVSAMLARRPEMMARAVDNHHQLSPLLQAASVLVIGPGFGKQPWAEQLFYHAMQYAIELDRPVVLDADALNLLAEGRIIKTLPAQCILTPHPGEAANLLNCSIEAIQHDRFAAVIALQKKYQATVILKGCGTLIASRERVSLCAYGNPGMASGGMGDVLSGVLGGLLAQHVSISEAAELAVCLHGYAADLVAEDKGERGILATDLIPLIQQLVNS